MSSSRDFSGKVIIVTGSSSGIGEDAVIYFAKSGAQVVVTGRNAERVARVGALCDAASPKQLKALQVVGDVTVMEDNENLIKKTIEAFGRLDVLINNAGFGIMASIQSPNILDVYESVFATNVKSVLHLSHLAIPYLEKTKGNIVNVSSVASLKAFPIFTIYCMSKAALDMLTKCMASELGPKGIRVNSLNPAAVKTEFAVNAGIPAENVDAMMERAAKDYPLRRVGVPADTTAALAYLASDEASFVTGNILTLDGGALVSAVSIAGAVKAAGK